MISLDSNWAFFAGISVPAAFLLGIALTIWARGQAIRRNVLDKPSERGMSQKITPRGGGISIVILASAGFVAAWALGFLPAAWATAFVLPGLVVAAIGLWDDAKGLPVRFRMGAQALCVTAAILLVRGIPSTPLDLLVCAALLVCLIWFVNAYNFIDGIDGIAGGQAAFGAAALSAIFLALGLPGLALGALVLAAASAGFLVLNWAPASVYMGDASSTYLGFVFGVFGLAGMDQPGFAWAWLLLFCVVLTDTTVTLLVRAKRGEKLSTPHRTHAFQLITLQLGSHGKFVFPMLGFLAFVAFPLAQLAMSAPWLGPWLALGLIALLACGVIAVRRKFGPDAQALAEERA